MSLSNNSFYSRFIRIEQLHAVIITVGCDARHKPIIFIPVARLKIEMITCYKLQIYSYND